MSQLDSLSMGFECPSANFENCIKHVFACTVLKSQYLKAVKGGN